MQTKETKFTPGPWRVMHSPKAGFLDVWSLGEDEPQSRKVVVEIAPSDTTVSDAKLIASAPTLLQALQIVDEKLSNGHSYSDIQEAVQEAILSATT